MIDDCSLEKLSRMLIEASEEEFTGSIQINLFKGSVANVVKNQSFKINDLK